MLAPALAGLRVLEAGNLMAAPFCTLQLATDLTCALSGAIAALAALRVRDPTGRGQFIDGEHSAQVLSELGYSRDQIRALASASVIREPA